MLKIGTLELVLILAVVVLIFGPSKLPALGKAVGQTISNFKRGLSAGKTESAPESDGHDA